MAIVNLLTERPEDGATLSEIADALGQSRATWVHVLASLSAGGFVVRRPADRRYHLGPALIGPGQVAAGRFPALGETRIAIEEIARTLGHPVFAFRRDGDHARLVDAVFNPGRPGPAMHIGDLLPIEPPLGSVFVAWNGNEAIESWLRRGPSSSITRDALRNRLGVSRAQGYVVELRPPPQLLHELVRLIGRGQQMRRAERISPAAAGTEQYLAETINPRHPYEVTTISVPVVGRDGTVEMSLNLFGFEGAVSGRLIKRLGDATRLAADRLSDRLSDRLQPRHLDPEG